MTVAPLFVKYAKLTLGSEGASADFQCSSTSIGITSEGGGAQSLTTLCPEGSFSESQPRTYNLNVTLVQDVENIDSFMFWLLEHDTDVVDFTYYPKTDSQGNPVGYGFKGKVTINAPDTIGGAESGNFATSTVTLPLQGKYSVVDRTGAVLPALDALNISKSVFGTTAAPEDLAALKADATFGDGNYTGPTMTTGQYVYLGDRTKAHYATDAWSAGAAT